MNTDYAAYRARALAYYQDGGVLTTRSVTQAAVMRRLKRDQQITAPLSKDLCRRIKHMVRTGVMQLMPFEEFVEYASGRIDVGHAEPRQVPPEPIV